MKHESPLQTEQMLDELAKSLTLEEHESLLKRLYYHGLNLEIQFFSTVPLYQKTSVPLLKQEVTSNCRYTIILSSTVLDSSAVLAESPILPTPEVEQNRAEKSSSDFRQELPSHYSEEYNEHLKEILRSQEGKASPSVSSYNNFLAEELEDIHKTLA